MDGIYGNSTYRKGIVPVPLGCNISLSPLYSHLHIELGVLGEGCNMMVRVHYLDSTVCNYVTCLDLFLTLGADPDSLRPVTVKPQIDLLQVKYKLSNILCNSRDCRKFVKNAVYLDRCYRSPLQRRKKYPPEGFTYGSSVSSL